MILNRWYLNPNVEPNDLLQQYPSILVCGTRLEGPENGIEFENNINFRHLFSIRIDSQPSVKCSTKVMYAELFGLSKKSIDCALKANMQYELLDILKAFVYNVQNKINDQDTENFVDINNPAIIKHKGRPQRDLKIMLKPLCLRENRR